jgi:ABC-type Co2+ transport system permease subunit
MDLLFNICVRVLQIIGDTKGLGYKAANIWIFVVIHPALTVYFFCLYRKYKRRYHKLTKT